MDVFQADEFIIIHDALLQYARNVSLSAPVLSHLSLLFVFRLFLILHINNGNKGSKEVSIDRGSQYHHEERTELLFISSWNHVSEADAGHRADSSEVGVNKGFGDSRSVHFPDVHSCFFLILVETRSHEPQTSCKMLNA